MLGMVGSMSFRNEIVHAKSKELLLCISKENLSRSVRDCYLSRAIYLQDSVGRVFDQFAKASIGHTGCPSLRFLLREETNLLAAREERLLH